MTMQMRPTRSEPKPAIGDLRRELDGALAVLAAAAPPGTRLAADALPKVLAASGHAVNGPLHRKIAKVNPEIVPLGVGYVAYRDPDASEAFRAATIKDFLQLIGPEGRLGSDPRFGDVHIIDAIAEYSGDYLATLDPSFPQDLEQLREEAADLVRQINPGARIAVVDHLYGSGPVVQASGAPSNDRRRVSGLFFKDLDLIAVSRDPSRGDPRKSILHELFHSVSPLLTDAEKAALVAGYAPGYRGRIADEKLADVFADWYIARSSGAKTDRRGFFSIGKFMEKLNNKHQKLGFRTFDDILGNIASGKVSQRRRLFSVDQPLVPLAAEKSQLFKGRQLSPVASVKEAAAIAREAGLENLAQAYEKMALRARNLEPITGEVLYRALRQRLSDVRIREVLKRCGYQGIDDPEGKTKLNEEAERASERALADALRATPKLLETEEPDTAQRLRALSVRSEPNGTGLATAAAVGDGGGAPGYPFPLRRAEPMVSPWDRTPQEFLEIDPLRIVADRRQVDAKDYQGRPTGQKTIVETHTYRFVGADGQSYDVPVKDAKGADISADRAALGIHKKLVSDALASGRYVSDRVLAHYPDLFQLQGGSRIGGPVLRDPANPAPAPYFAPSDAWFGDTGKVDPGAMPWARAMLGRGWPRPNFDPGRSLPEARRPEDPYQAELAECRRSPGYSLGPSQGSLVAMATGAIGTGALLAAASPDDSSPGRDELRRLIAEAAAVGRDLFAGREREVSERAADALARLVESPDLATGVDRAMEAFCRTRDAGLVDRLGRYFEDLSSRVSAAVSDTAETVALAGERIRDATGVDPAGLADPAATYLDSVRFSLPLSTTLSFLPSATGRMPPGRRALADDARVRLAGLDTKREPDRAEALGQTIRVLDDARRQLLPRELLAAERIVAADLRMDFEARPGQPGPSSRYVASLSDASQAGRSVAAVDGVTDPDMEIARISRAGVPLGRLMASGRVIAPAPSSDFVFDPADAGADNTNLRVLAAELRARLGSGAELLIRQEAADGFGLGAILIGDGKGGRSTIEVEASGTIYLVTRRSSAGTPDQAGGNRQPGVIAVLPSGTERALAGQLSLLIEAEGFQAKAAGTDAGRSLLVHLEGDGTGPASTYRLEPTGDGRFVVDRISRDGAVRLEATPRPHELPEVVGRDFARLGRLHAGLARSGSDIGAEREGRARTLVETALASPESGNAAARRDDASARLSLGAAITASLDPRRGERATEIHLVRRAGPPIWIGSGETPEDALGHASKTGPRTAAVVASVEPASIEAATAILAVASSARNRVAEIGDLFPQAARAELALGGSGAEHREYLDVPPQLLIKAQALGAGVDPVSRAAYVPDDAPEAVRGRLLGAFRPHDEVARTRQWLDVPPHHRALAGELGAGFDRVRHMHFVPESAEPEVAQMLRDTFPSTQGFRDKVAAAAAKLEDPEAPQRPEREARASQFNGVIDAALGVVGETLMQSKGSAKAAISGALRRREMKRAEDRPVGAATGRADAAAAAIGAAPPAPAEAAAKPILVGRGAESAAEIAKLAPAALHARATATAQRLVDLERSGRHVGSTKGALEHGMLSAGLDAANRTLTSRGSPAVSVARLRSETQRPRNQARGAER